MPLSKSNKWVSGLRPVTETGSNPKDELGVLKVPLGLVSPVANAVQALCMQDGAEKYGPYNYRIAKVQALIYLEAAKRHIDALLDGEDYDPLTGKPHVGYALATLQIYTDAWVNGFLIDNRPLPGKTGLIHSLFTRKPGEAEFTPTQIQSLFENIVHSHESPAPSQSHPVQEVSRVSSERASLYPTYLDRDPSPEDKSRASSRKKRRRQQHTTSLAKRRSTR